MGWPFGEEWNREQCSLFRGCAAGSRCQEQLLSFVSTARTLWHDGPMATPTPRGSGPARRRSRHHPDRSPAPRHRGRGGPLGPRRRPRPRRRLLGDLPLRAQPRRPAHPAGRGRVRRARRRRRRGRGRRWPATTTVGGSSPSVAPCGLGAARAGDVRPALRQPGARLRGAGGADDRPRHAGDRCPGAGLGRRARGRRGPGTAPTDARRSRKALAGDAERSAAEFGLDIARRPVAARRAGLGSAVRLRELRGVRPVRRRHLRRARTSSSSDQLEALADTTGLPAA